MRKWKKAGMITGVILFIGANAIAFMHAWRFTHYDSSDSAAKRTRNPQALSWKQKAGILFSGIDNPRPLPDTIPSVPFEPIRLEVQPGHNLAGWFIPARGHVKGAVALLHGYASHKASKLPEAVALSRMGYNCYLFDLRGSGCSDGGTVTLGYREADDVLAIYHYVAGASSEFPVYLLGSSMGAAALLRAMAVYDLKPEGIILEAPYKSMHTAVKNRFSLMGVPAFPMAQLLVFWGGAQHGFNGFALDCESYAAKVDVPVLLMYGTSDPTLTAMEMNDLGLAFPGPIQPVSYEGAGHESLFLYDEQKWAALVIPFLQGK